MEAIHVHGLWKCFHCGIPWLTNTSDKCNGERYTCINPQMVDGGQQSMTHSKSLLVSKLSDERVGRLLSVMLMMVSVSSMDENYEQSISPRDSDESSCLRSVWWWDTAIWCGGNVLLILSVRDRVGLLLEVWDWKNVLYHIKYVGTEFRHSFFYSTETDIYYLFPHKRVSIAAWVSHWNTYKDAKYI